MISDNCSEHFLVVLDFDDTIVEGNSEESVKRILQNREIPLPVDLVNHYDTHRDWNLYINLLYKFLHDNRITQHDIENSLNTISFVKDSDRLLQRLAEMKTKRKIDVIIISGGNVLVIQKILENASLHKVVDQILSNPAEFDSNGLLNIGLLNTHNCSYCFNGEMCKGVVIRNYISKKYKDCGISYQKIFFAGDYLNDICLCLELRENDFAFAREGYPLHKDLENRKAKGQLKANLTRWTTGDDIIKMLEKQLEIF